jgi:hypothetical protein
MRFIAVVASAVVLAGCATNASVHKKVDSVANKPPHNRDVCFMTGPLPEGVDADFLGIGVSNSHWYGGYAGPKRVLADKARATGVDVLTEMQHRQVIGFFAVVRPRVQGRAYSLKDPAAFNCQQLGGEVYGPYGPKAFYNPAPTAITPASPAYDDCMTRVMRISDPSLRLQAMTACDGAK